MSSLQKQLQRSIEVGGFEAWERTLILSPALVTPVRFFWADYRRFCQHDGFPALSVGDFMRFLRTMEALTIKTGGTGLIRRVAEGAAPGNWRD